MNFLERFAYKPTDDTETRKEKVAAILISGPLSIAGLVWTGMYYMVFGWGIITFLPLLFSIIVGTCIGISHIKKNHLWAVYATIICIIYITSFIQWTIGGLFDSGFVLVWAFCGPVTALMFFSLRQALFWLFVHLLNIAITVVFNDYFIAHGQPVAESTRLFFFVMNLTASSLVTFIFAYFFVSNTLAEREKANQLLLNILPKSIANRLKNENGIIAKGHTDVSVLFADIVGFTEYSSVSSPEEIVSSLDKIFKAFDELTLKHGLEKIKTIGDAYMVAAGIPDPVANHAQSTALLAIDMLSAMEKLRGEGLADFSLRIGINSGPAVAGVIGKSKFAYDIWGDTVNTASRMESFGEAGRVNVSETTYNLIKDSFNFIHRGKVAVKGKGEIDMYFMA